MKPRAWICRMAAAIILVAGATGARPRQSADTFVNPLLPSGPDPWITRDGPVYYFMRTMGDRLTIWKTRDITDLAHAAKKTVWMPPAAGPNAISIWAPELHRIGGTWFLYYTAAERGHDDDAHRGIFVLENDDPDPLSGTWTDRGRINTLHSGIDGTTFSYRGVRYFAYSPYVGPDSVLAIARMANPWTLTGQERIIARPDRAWERQGGRQIVEAPEFLRGPGGDAFLTYSASACWSDDYAIGQLRAPAGSDLLDPRVWSKSPEPILATAADRGVFAPGHNGFFTSPDGRENWIVYHANPKAGMGCTAQRAPRIQRFRFGADGTPIFGASDGSLPLRKPSHSMVRRHRS